MSDRDVTEDTDPCITDAPKPTDPEALDKELDLHVDGLMTRLVQVANLARDRGRQQLMFSLHRAWHEIDKGRQL
jgi:hypothetical protein